MKVVVPSNTPSKKKELIIPLLEEDDSYKLTKDNATSWELRTVPGNNDSPTYKLMVRILEGNEQVRQITRWRREVLKVCIGCNATDLASRKPIMEACMRPGPLNIFSATLQAYAEVAYQEALKEAKETDRAAGDTVASDAVTANGVDHYHTNEHLDAALREVVTSLVPRKVLAKVKKDLRRDMRKPLSLRIRTYFQAVMRINEEELPNLPPFGANQSLSADEILDILLFGTPRSWQTEMDRQGFDPIERGLMATVDFMENLEDLEDKPDFKQVKSKSNKSSKKDSKDKGDTESASKKKAPYYCKQHGPNYTHDTSDCRVLKKKDSSKGNHSHKTWTHKADENTSASKKELAALVAKVVKKEIKGAKKQLASVSKKRKSGDETDSDEECCLVQMLEKPMDGFNYKQMEALSINDKTTEEIEDEISV